MAYKLPDQDGRLPKIAASAIRAFEPVRNSASAANEVLPVASNNVRVAGVALATAASPGVPVSVDTEGVVLCRAATTIAVNTLVTLASTNGRLGPAIVASAHEIVGEAQVSAVDGDIFSVLLKPLNPLPR